MAGPACLLPAQCVRLYDLAQQRRWTEADRLQRQLWVVNEVFQRHALAACVKAGLELQGFEVGDPVAPVPALSREAREEVRRALETAGRPLEERATGHAAV